MLKKRMTRSHSRDKAHDDPGNVGRTSASRLSQRLKGVRQEISAGIFKGDAARNFFAGKNLKAREKVRKMEYLVYGLVY